jgi:hypothetical protein
MAAEIKLKKRSSGTCLNKDVSIVIACDPCYIPFDTLFKRKSQMSDVVVKSYLSWHAMFTMYEAGYIGYG